MNQNVDEKFAELREMGMDGCQLLCWNEALMTDEMAALVSAAMAKHQVRVTAFWCGWPGPVTWDFYEGQLTLGLVPSAYRHARTLTLLKGSDFAHQLGVKYLVTHVGYLPENPYDPDYQGVLTAVRAVAKRCARNGQSFLFETGQETPVAMRRAIEDIGLDNVGVNLDPANLLMYGKANPCDALRVFGQYVHGIHCKDGMYPTNGHDLGEEKALGEGLVDFPRLVGILKELGYDGDYTIEREISGEEQKRDILNAKAMLEKLI
ncbi:MAG: sugar phosphate isomerase/epimerase [Eubacteriales bacterium]|nr:sugar phosphate isomerase/epimerase [Eubacteriales bacterium]